MSDGFLWFVVTDTRAKLTDMYPPRWDEPDIAWLTGEAA